MAAMPACLPAWAVMWTVSGSIFLACKWATWLDARTVSGSMMRQAGYLFAWPGMDAAAFLGPRTAARPTHREWMSAGAMTGVGLTLFYAVARIAGPERPLLAGWLGMIGLVLSLHFGTFQVLSCAWRHAGVNAAPLMRGPSRSISLGEFWSRRWNSAFRDLTHRFVFAPLTKRLGPRTALLAGFVVSGVVHDIVISWPAGGGCGGPTAYFIGQGFGILAERSATGRRLQLGRAWRGRAFAAATLVLPLPLLFHAPFVTRVVVPFMDALGAL